MRHKLTGRLIIDEILFAHRFKAFQQVDCLPHVTYQHFLTQTDVSTLPEKGIFADRLYLLAVIKQMQDELVALVRIAKTNMVSNRVAAMQSQQTQAAAAAEQETGK